LGPGRFGRPGADGMIIVFGSLNVDLVMPVGHFPQPGETVLCTTDYLSRAGGKGANQAVAAAKAGAKVAFVGKVGDDAFGRRCVNNLKNHSIWASGIGISERPTGCATIAVDRHGANFAVSAPGANLEATSDQVPDEVFTPKNIVLTQMEVMPKETFSVLSRAKKRGAVTILDASPANPVPLEVLKTVDYLIANELEGIALARSHGIETTDAAEAAKGLAKLASLTCIITRGTKGFVAAKDGGLFTGESLPVEVVDTTGAGDTFCGVFAACLQREHSWLSALHRASIGASLACLVLGAQDGVPSMDDIEEHLDKIGQPHKVA